MQLHQKSGQKTGDFSIQKLRISLTNRKKHAVDRRNPYVIYMNHEVAITNQAFRDRKSGFPERMCTPLF